MSKKSKNKKTVSDKKLVAGISIFPRDIQTQTLFNGEVIHKIIVDSGYYEIGYTNDHGKLKHAFRSPNFTISSWHDEMNFGGHFCFVDTNKVKNILEPGLDYATGFFILQISDYQRNGTEITAKVDDTKSIFSLRLLPSPGIGECPEKRGWEYAIESMKNIGVEKANIIVDAHQAELYSLSKELPEGWKYLYASSDRSGGTWFDKVFSQLDKTIKKLTKIHPKDSSIYSEQDIKNYLLGRVEHLLKIDGSH